YVATTERAGAVARGEALAWSMHPIRLLGLVAPSVFPLEGLQPWSELFEENAYRESFLSSLYLSLPLIVLAAVAIARDRRSRLVAGAAGVLLLAAFGRFGAPGELPTLMDAIRHVPPFDRFRYPE